MNEQVRQFIQNYQLFQDDQVQQSQLMHRFALVEAFELKEGMRVLEVGCGQGDTTVALAHAVGPSGKVVAIDIAPSDYGAPFTLGQAHDRLRQSKIGHVIDFHVETDFLNFTVEQPFDAIVFSHCSWYFADEQLLGKYFKRAKAVAQRICFAEWDLTVQELDQHAHFLAVSIQALFTQFVETDGNIQHVYDQTQITSMLENANLHVQKQLQVDASYLQDGEWEIASANELVPQFANAPAKLRSLVSSYAAAMNASRNVKSLNSFVIIAH